MKTQIIKTISKVLPIFLVLLNGTFNNYCMYSSVYVEIVNKAKEPLDYFISYEPTSENSDKTRSIFPKKKIKLAAIESTSKEGPRFIYPTLHLQGSRIFFSRIREFYTYTPSGEHKNIILEVLDTTPGKVNKHKAEDYYTE